MRTRPHPRRASPDHPAGTEPTGSGGHDGTHDTEVHGPCGSDEAARIEPSRPGRHHRTLAAGLALAGAAALTACTPASHPAATAPSSAPSATASPTPSLPAPAPSPTQPPEMTRDDETGAVAAANFFLTALYPYAVRSQDTTSWDSYSGQICTFCASLKESILAEKGAEQFTVPGRILVTKQRVTELDAVRFQVDFEVSQSADVTYSVTGDVLGGRPARTLDLTFLVVRNPGQWLIGGVDVRAVNGQQQ